MEVAHEAWDETDPLRLREEGVTGVAAPEGGIWDRLNLPLSLPMVDWEVTTSVPLFDGIR